MVIDKDPVLGNAIANYPSNRARLLLIGGSVLLITWVIVTVALLNVPADTALLLTIVSIGIVTIGVGWFIAHFWNREVVLYEHGFSYREGSYVAYMLYTDVRRIRQRAERMTYFGGVIRRTVYRITLETTEDEIIVLSNIYRRMGDLSIRLEQLVNPFLKAAVERTLAQGDAAAFGETLSLTTDGLRDGERELAWADFGGYTIGSQHLMLQAQGDDTPWLSVKLTDVDNLSVLIEILKQHQRH